MQIARAIGARVVGTVRSPAKAERARALGLEHVVVAEAGRFADQVLSLTQGHGVDVVLDLVGGSYVEEELACLSAGGRILSVGTMAGPAARVDLSVLMRKRATLRGTVLRARPLEEKILAARALARHLVPLFEAGRLRPVVDRILPLARASEAHATLERNDTFGKIVLEV
jgi:NADPH:quinone reductase-like Zn-dependent oxidoreductase